MHPKSLSSSSSQACPPYCAPDASEWQGHTQLPHEKSGRCLWPLCSSGEAHFPALSPSLSFSAPAATVWLEQLFLSHLMNCDHRFLTGPSPSSFFHCFLSILFSKTLPYPTF